MLLGKISVPLEHQFKFYFFSENTVTNLRTTRISPTIILFGLFCFRDSPWQHSELIPRSVLGITTVGEGTILGAGVASVSYHYYCFHQMLDRTLFISVLLYFEFGLEKEIFLFILVSSLLCFGKWQWVTFHYETFFILKLSRAFSIWDKVYNLILVLL